MTKTQHINLIIATPGYNLTGAYVKSLLATINELSSKGISVLWTNDYSSHVADAREVTLSGTKSNDLDNSKPLEGKFTYDKILWIDSDIEWTPDDALKLYNSEHDIISGAYLLANGTVTLYAEEHQQGFSFQTVKEKNSVEKVASSGFGFICIKSGVFEKMERPWFQSWPTTITLNKKEYNFNVIGEDMSWCARAKSLGFDIYADFSVKVVHHKTLRLTWEGPQP